MSADRDLLLANFDRMRREMDELFGDAFCAPALGHRRRGGFSPAVDVFYEGDPPRAVVNAEIAGVDSDAIGIEISGRQLVIAGHRRPPQAEGRLYQQLEIVSGAFRRVIELGADVVADQAQAAFKDGILHIELPLADPESRTKTVPITRPNGTEQIR